MKCRICGSENTRKNSARTIFCDDCNLCVSYAGKIERMPKHPLYEKHGWRIAKCHSDYGTYPQVEDLRGKRNAGYASSQEKKS